MNTFDVIIVGAGPAGCASALMLSNQGLRIGLVDFQKSNAFKIGESLPGAAIRMLRKLGISDLSQLLEEGAYLPTTSNASAWGSDDWHYQDALFNPEGGGWHLDRKRFDEALLQEVKRRGITFISGKAIKISWEEVNSSFKLAIDAPQNGNLTVDASWVIDASGRTRSIIRQLGQMDQTQETEQMAAVTWVNAGIEDMDMATRIKSVENGWWYTAKLPGQCRVIALFGDAEDVSILVKSPNLLIQSFNDTEIIPAINWLESDLLDLQVSKANASMASRVIGNQWLAVGDAALSLDPLSSQGIFFGLYSGIKGAETVAETIRNPDIKSSLADQYLQSVQKVFNEHQKTRRYHYLQEMRYIQHPYWARWFQPVEG